MKFPGMPWWLFGAGLLLAAAAGFSIGRGGLYAKDGEGGLGSPAKSSDRGDALSLLDERARTEELLRPIISLGKEMEWNPALAPQLWERVRALDVAQIRAALATHHPYPLVTQLMARWAELDPAAAMDAAETYDMGFFCSTVFEVWLKTDAAAALEWMQRHPGDDNPSIAICRYSFGDYLAEATPEKALQIAATLSPELQDAIIVSLTNLDYKDEAGRRAVLELIERCEDKALKSRMEGSLFRQWFKVDHDAAAQLLEGFDVPAEERESLLRAELYEWSERLDLSCEAWLVKREGLCGSVIQKQLLWRQFQFFPERVGDWLKNQGATTEHYRKLADAARADGYNPGYSGPDKVGTVEFIAPLIAEWRKLDAAAADAWLEEAKREKEAGP